MDFVRLIKRLIYRSFQIGIYRIYNIYLDRQIRKRSIPQHIGIILDGNRRWATKNMYARRLGHLIGAENTEQVLEWCHDLGIKSITLYALSTENLERPEEEVKELLAVVENKLKDLLDDERIHKYKINVKSLGKLDLLPKSILEIMKKLEKTTINYNDHFLNIALAYGGRLEILDGVKEIVNEVSSGKLSINNIDLNTVESHLYTAHLPNPEPDLIIRTSGEERLSGFLLWQCAYSELVFMDVYWPDFRKIDLMRAIRTYQRRSRRHGK